MNPGALLLLALGAAAALVGCIERSRLPEHADVGPYPALLPARAMLLPTVNVAEAAPWAEGRAPVAARGLRVGLLAGGLEHPRWLLVLPNGDVLVAETNAPPRARQGGGIRDLGRRLMQARAGAAGPSADRITLLRDADADGQAELRTPFLQGLNSPFGMVLVGDRLYVANTDAVMEFPYRSGQTRVDEPGRRLAELPAGAINHHWTRGLIASPDGRKLYASVGSNSNIAENGIAAEEGRAAVWEIDRASGARRVFATGLRNANGMAWMAGSRRGGAPVLWTVVNERDELGSDLVPDYLTALHEGDFYGWPWSWWGGHVDKRVKPRRPDMAARARVPDYALGAHVAPLGMVASEESALTRTLAPGFAGGVFIALHGSWNRRPMAGYKVVFLPFSGGRPRGLPVDVLTGFVDTRGRAHGRPVGLALDTRGGLLVADDVGNTVWRVETAEGPHAPAAAQQVLQR